MNILVTGGAGFIGSHVIKALLRDGHTITSVDNVNDYYDPTLKVARLNEFKKDITFYKLDISDLSALEKVFRKHAFDKICHLAAQAGVRYSIEDPLSYALSNYVGTQNIFELAKRYNVPHIVFASSSSVYGCNKKLPFHEDDRVDTPMSVYATSKRACELLAFNYNYLFDSNITALRFFTVYGPFGRPDMALFKFTKAMLADKPIDIYNNGDMMRDFTYIDDIVQGFARALEKPNGFTIYNLGHGHPVSLMEFIGETERALGVEAKKNFMPMQMGDVKATYADVSKAKRELGFDPKVKMSEGVAHFIGWYKTYYHV